MKTSIKGAIIGGLAVVVLLVWLLLTLFTGRGPGEACHAGTDSDCKGWKGRCLLAKDTSYCSRECKTDQDCPDAWSCAGVGITNIDAKGNISKSTSDLRMCLRADPSSAASSSAAPPIVVIASTPPPPPIVPLPFTTPMPAVAPTTSTKAPKAPGKGKRRPR